MVMTMTLSLIGVSKHELMMCEDLNIIVTYVKFVDMGTEDIFSWLQIIISVPIY
jgi:hypothetical protein